jgi:hypothetical protein
MKNVYIILITIIVIFLAVQYKYINRKNNEIDVIQIENPQKDIFESIIHSNNISIFTNVGTSFYGIQTHTLKDINHMDDISKKNLVENVKNHFSYYDIPFLYKSDVDILIESANTSSIIQKQTSYRLLICQLKGVSNIICFTPNQSKYLYLTKSSNNTQSSINFWNDNLLDYPLLSNTKYIEIKLYPGQMIYIPYGWYYGCSINEDSVKIVSSSESVFSKMLLHT